jgi:NDP-sugar pyrophosphorylase family protein
MQLIVPMAGLGQRFADAGYATPKPLIPIGGVPMVVRAVQDLPHAEHVVFVVHPRHVEEYRVDRALREYFPGCSVVVTPGLTEGQACTVRLGCDEIDLDDDVLVCACDNTHVYDPARFDRMASESDAEAMIWTYRDDARVLRSPRSFGWVRTRPDQVTVVDVSCKQPISETPIKDHVVSGTFWFASGRLMRNAIDQLVGANRRVRNEFYMDVVPNLLLEASRSVLAFEVEKYIGWGTPDEFEDFLRWQRYFSGLRESCSRAA